MRELGVRTVVKTIVIARAHLKIFGHIPSNTAPRNEIQNSLPHLEDEDRGICVAMARSTVKVCRTKYNVFG